VLDDISRLHPWHQPWLDAVHTQLRRAKRPPARRRLLIDTEAVTDLTIEVFWAPPWSGSRGLVSWLEPEQALADGRVERVEAIPLSGAREVVAVAGGGDQPFWIPPGGRREKGESLEATLRRELLEEACAQLTSSQLIGFQHCRYLNGARAGEVTLEAMFWARIELDAFMPNSETHARRLMSLADAYELGLWRNPLTRRALDRVAAIEALVHV